LADEIVLRLGRVRVSTTGELRQWKDF